MKKTILFFLFIILINSISVFAEPDLPSQQAETFPDSFFIRGNEEKKEVALTFDDGPDPKNTPQILDILKENDIKATFFLVGQQVKEYPEITARIKDEGHQLANHSYSHRNFSQFKDDYIVNNEIYLTSMIIEIITGYYPKILRPPYGEINNSTVKKLKQKNWKIVNWSIDTHDWFLDSEQIIEIIKDEHHKGGIVLMHSTERNETTVKILPEIIEILKKAGYEFRTITQLLENI